MPRVNKGNTILSLSDEITKHQKIIQQNMSEIENIKRENMLEFAKKIYKNFNVIYLNSEEQKNIIEFLKGGYVLWSLITKYPEANKKINDLLQRDVSTTITPEDLSQIVQVLYKKL